MVDAVVELPFWGPSSLYVPEDFGGGYAEDYDFLVDFRNASMERERLEKWIEEWVMSVDHQKYLEKLGYERLLYLAGKSRRDAWKYKIVSKESKISKEPEPSEVESMILVAERKLKNALRRVIVIFLRESETRISPHGSLTTF